MKEITFRKGADFETCVGDLLIARISLGTERMVHELVEEHERLIQTAKAEARKETAELIFNKMYMRKAQLSDRYLMDESTYNSLRQQFCGGEEK